jgi:conjugative relaxase-like TrwC/TraI family protein
MAARGYGVVTLRIEALTSAKAVEEYYNSIQAAYYAGQGQPGIWGGKGADLLKLSGSVRPEQFSALVNNINPTSIDAGKPRKLTLRSKKNRRVAYDANTHAPKSVSLLHALTGDSRLSEAFQKANKGVMNSMERLAATRVRKGGGESTDRSTGNLVWASFMEYTSRPVKGVPYPQMHGHNPIINATFDSEENCWKAAQFGEIKRRAPVFQAMFSMHLARLVRDELGYEIEWDGAKWEIKGVNSDLLKRFSPRAAVIEAAAQEHNVRSPDEKAKLAAKTREKKTKHSPEELTKIWSGLLAEGELEQLTSIKTKALHQADQPMSRKIAPAEAVHNAIERLSSHASIWTRDDLLTEALYAGRGYVNLEQIEAVLHAPEFAGKSPSKLLRSTYKDREVFTTERILQEEQSCIRLAAEGRGIHDALGEPLKDSKVGNRRLSDEQMAAVQQIAASTDFVTCFHGRAGTGKSTSVKAIIPALEAKDRRIITLAPTHKAVEVLKSDGFADSMTLAKFLSSAARTEIPYGAVIWLDEAGMTGMKDMAFLLRLAKTHGCRVVLAGDVSQHSSVSRGDALRLMMLRAGLNIASVSTIVRQTDADYREAVQQLAHGKTDAESPERGLKILQNRGSIFTYPESSTRFGEAAKKIAGLAMSGESFLAIAPTHGEIGELTLVVRRECAERGLIDSRSCRAVTVLRRRDLLAAEKQYAFVYRNGDVIELNRDTAMGCRGRRFIVTSTDSCADQVTVRDEQGNEQSLDLKDADKFDVSVSSTIEVAIGDRIRVTKTSLVDGEYFIGGMIQTVKGFDAGGNLILDDGRVLPHGFGHLDYGWATTSHSSQGMTVDNVVIVQSAASGRAASLEQVYVSASRGKKDVWVYTDDSKSLRQAVGRTSERRCAMEVFLPPRELAPTAPLQKEAKPQPVIIPLPLAQKNPEPTQPSPLPQPKSQFPPDAARPANPRPKVPARCPTDIAIL